MKFKTLQTAKYSILTKIMCLNDFKELKKVNPDNYLDEKPPEAVDNLQENNGKLLLHCCQETSINVTMKSSGIEPNLKEAF